MAIMDGYHSIMLDWERIFEGTPVLPQNMPKEYECWRYGQKWHRFIWKKIQKLTILLNTCCIKDTISYKCYILLICVICTQVSYVHFIEGVTLLQLLMFISSTLDGNRRLSLHGLVASSDSMSEKFLDC